MLRQGGYNGAKDIQPAIQYCAQRSVDKRFLSPLLSLPAVFCSNCRNPCLGTGPLGARALMPEARISRDFNFSWNPDGSVCVCWTSEELATECGSHPYQIDRATRKRSAR